MLFGKWATFRALHSSVGAPARDRIARTMARAGRTALDALPTEGVYSALAPAAHVHNEAVAIAAFHARPELTGRCLWSCALFSDCWDD